MKSMKADAEGSEIPARSWLFVPANNPRRVEKAFASAADAIILDLEDAVPQSEKAAARAAAVLALGGSDRPQLVYVRVNALDTAHAFDDLETVVAANPDGIMLPMTASARDVQTLDWLLTQFERKSGSDGARTKIIALIETAKGIANVTDIAAASPRLAALAFGAGDFTADMNLHWSREESELLPHRSSIALASRAADIAPPLDAVWVEMADRDGMTASATRSRDHGFQGKMCIHPDQVAVVNQAYTPSADAVAKAKRIVDAFSQAEQAGTGAIQLEGKMIDYPIVAAARALLAEHERARRRGK